MDRRDQLGGGLELHPQRELHHPRVPRASDHAEAVGRRIHPSRRRRQTAAQDVHCAGADRALGSRRRARDVPPPDAAGWPRSNTPGGVVQRRVGPVATAVRLDVFEQELPLIVEGLPGCQRSTRIATWSKLPPLPSTVMVWGPGSA